MAGSVVQVVECEGLTSVRAWVQTLLLPLSPAKKKRKQKKGKMRSNTWNVLSIMSVLKSRGFQSIWDCRCSGQAYPVPGPRDAAGISHRAGIWIRGLDTLGSEVVY
jgi:hypothetical protein